MSLGFHYQIESMIELNDWKQKYFQIVWLSLEMNEFQNTDYRNPTSNTLDAKTGIFISLFLSHFH